MQPIFNQTKSASHGLHAYAHAYPVRAQLDSTLIFIYAASADTTLHAGVARHFEVPSQQLTSKLALSADGFYERTHRCLDTGQFGVVQLNLSAERSFKVPGAYFNQRTGPGSPFEWRRFCFKSRVTYRCCDSDSRRTPRRQTTDRLTAALRPSAAWRCDIASGWQPHREWSVLHPRSCHHSTAMRAP